MKQIRKKPSLESSTQRIDAWGVVWERSIADSGKGQAKQYPIQDITKQSEYQFPHINHPDYFAKIKSFVEHNNITDNPKYVLGVAPFSSLNELNELLLRRSNYEAMWMDY